MRADTHAPLPPETLTGLMKTYLKQCLPTPLVRRLHWNRLQVGRRLDPVRRRFGFNAGTPIDRYYIASFLSRHRADIHGDVLEVRDNNYTRAIGGTAVTNSDILDIDPNNRRATMVGDLTHWAQFPSARFDCIILTQVLQQIFDLPAAITTLHHMLKPGGVVLATVPGITAVDRYAFDRAREHWRFTTLSAQRLFAATFPVDRVETCSSGNVYAAMCFLYGVVIEEMDQAALDHYDEEYPVSIAIRARKEDAGCRAPVGESSAVGRSAARQREDDDRAAGLPRLDLNGAAVELEPLLHAGQPGDPMPRL
jgi:SAM-dependent methyltransferase